MDDNGMTVAEKVAAGGCNTCHERGGELVSVDGSWWVVCGGCGDEWTLAEWSAPMPVVSADDWHPAEMAQRPGRLVRMVGCTLTCGHGGPCAPGRVQSADGCSAETDTPTVRDLLIDAHNVLLRHALGTPDMPHPAIVGLGGNVEGVQVTFPRGYVLVTVDAEDPDGAPAYLVSVCPGDDVAHDHTEDAFTRTTLAHLDWSMDVLARHLSR